MQYTLSNKLLSKMLSRENGTHYFAVSLSRRGRGSGPYSSPKTVTSSEMDHDKFSLSLVYHAVS
jgi:hypothetical protein